MSRHPIVYRVQPLRFSQLSAVRFHAERRGGDLSHITPPELYEEHGRAAPITVLYDDNGQPLPDDKQRGWDWVKTLKAEEREAARFNTARQVENLEKRGKHKEAKRRKIEGDKPAYRRNGKGGAPLREVILSANSAFFAKEGEDIKWDKKKLRQFLKAGTEFLEEEWGPALRYVRIDLDEGTPHIHAVVCHWHEETTKSGAKQKMAAPTKHPSYDTEKAQDRAGEWFKGLGLVRGEKRAQARRTALEEGKAPPPKRRHVSPAQWRGQKAAELKIRENSVAKREQEADAVLALAGGVRAGAVEDNDARAAVEKAQAEASKREVAKAQAIAQAKALKTARDAEARRRAAIAKAAKAAAAKKAAHAKARPPRQAPR